MALRLSQIPGRQEYLNKPDWTRSGPRGYSCVMYQWVALFRGINVGGHNRLPMQDLVASLAGQGCEDIATYIQSGNVVFCHREPDAQKLSRSISEQISKDFGISPNVFLMSADELADCAARNPFKKAEAKPRSLHVSFLSDNAANAEIDALEALRSDGEEFRLIDKVFYLHAPNGIGRSKLAAKAEKLLGVTITARNWRTVSKLLEMAREQQGSAVTDP